jgi:hypothetical protein
VILLLHGVTSIFKRLHRRKLEVIVIVVARWCGPCGRVASLANEPTLTTNTQSVSQEAVRRRRIVSWFVGMAYIITVYLCTWHYNSKNML